MGDEEKPEETPAVEEVKKSEEELPDIKQVVYSTEGFPGQAKIDEWKALHGEIFATAFSPEESFIFRAVNRKEWTELQRGAMEHPEADQEEALIIKCVLWSNLNLDEMKRKAGTLSSLADNISRKSNFMDPRFVVAMTVKL